MGKNNLLVKKEQLKAQMAEQRAHDKEYWLIFAHVIPFLMVIYASAAILLFAKGWLFRKFAKDVANTPGPDG